MKIIKNYHYYNFLHVGRLFSMDEAELRGQINKYLVREKITREEFCHRTGISAATLNKCMTGKMRFSEKTISKIKDILALDGESKSEEIDSYKNYGGYSKLQASKYIGSYVTFRPSFSDSGSFFVYLTDIIWNDSLHVLEFIEKNRNDSEHCQNGYISIPLETNYVYFIVNAIGNYRLTISRRDIFSGDIYGLVNTLKSTNNGALVPVSTYIYMIPFEKCPHKSTGIIKLNDKGYTFFKDKIDKIKNKKLIEFINI